MSDFENFKLMLSHGFQSNKDYEVINEIDNHKNKIIEKKRMYLNGVHEQVIYHQFIFDKDGEFISWQTSLNSFIK